MTWGISVNESGCRYWLSRWEVPGWLFYLALALWPPFRRGYQHHQVWSDKIREKEHQKLHDAQCELRRVRQYGHMRWNARDHATSIATVELNGKDVTGDCVAADEKLGEVCLLVRDESGDVVCDAETHDFARVIKTGDVRVITRQ